jgi:hypothetical protein
MSELGELLEPALPELLPCDHADPAYIANAPLNTRLDNTTALLFIYSPFQVLFTPKFICLLTDNVRSNAYAMNTRHLFFRSVPGAVQFIYRRRKIASEMIRDAMLNVV